MNYKLTNWTLANEELPPEPVKNTPVPGDWYLLITEAAFDEENNRYIIHVEDLNNEGVSFPVTYFLTRQDGTKNFYAYKTLKTLADALFFGADITIPNPVDIIGMVVTGRVSLTEPKAGEDPATARRYARVNEYFPVPEKVARDICSRVDENGDPLQYYEGRLD